MNFSQRIFVALASASLTLGPVFAQQPARLSYPETKTGTQVDDYHGVQVADPYRWLEDLDSPETAAWVTAQNEVTFGYLRQIPQRDSIRERMTALWNYEKFGVPFKEGGRYFYSRNSGLQNQSVLLTADSLDAAPRELLDPNTLSKDGTVALAGMSISDDGNLMAYGLSQAGSDWVEYRVRDVRSGKDLDTLIKWVKFSGAAWTKDNAGFFYSRFDEPKSGENLLEASNFHQKLYYHKLGTPQSQDVLVYHAPDAARKDWGFSGGVSDDGKYLIISVWQGTERKNRVYFADLTTGPQPYGDAGAAVVKMLDAFDAQYSFVDNDGPIFFFFTDNAAPRGRLVAIDSRDPAPAKWKEIIPQSADTLQGVSLVNDTFIATYLKDAATQVKLYDLSGRHVRDVALPGVGTAGGFAGKRKDTETFYTYTSFNYPPTIFRYDMKSGQSSVFRKPTVAFNPDEYEVKQVFYESEGARVPMFITHRKGLTLDGNNPTLLYAYGGFNIPITPSFSVANVVWMELGGVYASACIRGGGEYGKEWHDAGRLKNKQNCFDDFIAAGEWLIANKYTSSSRLAIRGGSNGGLLVGAVLNQRPDLFAAALPEVGVMDMLRFHKFTIGHAWRSDFGDPDKPEDFQVIHKYSPLHNIRPGVRYPSTMILTGDHDDRVVPSHSFKYAAALQAAHKGDNPVLIRIETRAGHGAGKPTTKLIEEAADRWAFLVKTLGMNGSVN